MLDILYWKTVYDALFGNSTMGSMVSLTGTYDNHDCVWVIDIPKFMHSLMHRGDLLNKLDSHDIISSLREHAEEIYDSYVQGIYLQLQKG